MASVEERNKRQINTAACLIIGDEVLGGKTRDTNSSCMAKWCFDLGIALKRIEVIEDDEEQIVEAVRRMSDRYDFVVTSGGIGPTHDDITYPSIAKAFGLKLKFHDEAFERMKKSWQKKSNPDFNWDRPSDQRTARMRMVELPIDETRDISKQALFPCDDKWVPVSVVNGNIHILPGVPDLFASLLKGLEPFIVARLENKPIVRILISSPMSESAVAKYLTELQAEVQDNNVKVGSYPRYGKTNIITLVGKDKDYMESKVAEVVKAVRGKRVKVEEEDDEKPEYSA